MREKDALAMGLRVSKRKVPGKKAGEKCGIVRGNTPPCTLILDVRGKCLKHCRAETVNADSVSELCPQWRMRGAGGCLRHGGKNRKGALHPQFKDGRWSKYAPNRYAGLVEAVSAGDPLDLHDDIHLVSARIAELLACIDEQGSPDFVRQVKLQTSKLRGSLQSVMTNEAMSILTQLEAIINSAAKDFTLWGEVSDLFGQRVKMVESQRKRDLEGGRYISADDMIATVNAMGRALKNKIESRLPKAEADSLLTDIGVEFAVLQGVTQQQPIIEGGDQ